MTIWVRLHITALALWVGVMLSLIGLAPVAFQTLPQAQAGDLMNRLFAPYHIVGYVCGGLALLTAWFAGGLRGKIRNLLLIGALGATLYAGMVISPEARTLRAELRQVETTNPVTKARFDTLHRRAVVLNGAVLIGAVTALVWAVISPPKRQK
jgi:hypothetical protein